MHEVFTPPRVDDLIGGTGTVVAVHAERSRNAEIGVRGCVRSGVTWELAAFDNDVDNQIAVGSIGAGGTPLAQGQARYRGLEAAARATFGIADAGGLYLQLAHTALPVAEQSSALQRVVNVQPVAGSAAGRRMPYAPFHTRSMRLGYLVGGWDTSLEGVYTSRQFADSANTGAAPANGNGPVGALDAATLLNLAVNYALGDSGWTVYGIVKNAADRVYIADCTRGILPGAGRQVVLRAAYRFRAAPRG